MGAGDQIQAIMDLGLTDKNGKPLFSEEMLQLKVFETQLIAFSSNLKAVFGENGTLPAALGNASANLVSIFTNMNDVLSGDNDPAEKIGAVASAIAGSIQQLSSVFSAYMQQNIKEIDNLIAAEKAETVNQKSH